MLKYRVIFGLLFSALFLALIWADSFVAAKGYTPRGAFIALATVIVVPLALREMQLLLAKDGVVLSLRVATVACLLCALWPWVEQVAEQATPPAPEFPAHVNYATVINSPQTDQPPSTWAALAARVRTVKPHYLVPTVLAATMLAALALHSKNQKVQGAMASAGGTLLAVVYLGVLPGFFLPICLSHSSWMFLAIICIVKSADIGAYTVGRLLGKHKLIPWLSPGKTLEGFLGGLLFSGAIGIAAAACFKDFTWQQGLFAGVVLGAVGQVGDLLESLLKRDAGVKDSGAVPGFGGILDILDSPLLAAPAAYWLLKLLVKS
jgi:CDP-diglyceride synthetase